jgi:hypothetical protein
VLEDESGVDGEGAEQRLGRVFRIVPVVAGDLAEIENPAGGRPSQSVQKAN